MKAIELHQTGGVENFQYVETETPSINSNEVLIKTKSISINPVDFKVRTDDGLLSMINGTHRPVIVGWDVAGEVVEVGNEVSNFKIGDRAFGMINFPGSGNAYAEFVSAPEDQITVIPNNINYTQAAATTLAALTALQALKPNVKAGDRVLIHAGSGGVGHFAIQIAKSLGAHVITTSSAQNKDFVLSFGADEHIDYQSQKFEEILSEIDFVLDMFNGDILLNSVKVAAAGAAVISLPTPNFSDEILSLAKSKNVLVSQIMVTSNGEDMKTLAEMLANGTIKPHISREFEFSDMGKAHLQLESGRTVGKVIVNL
ncbi:MAG: NADP-dependent oxidoreductase [Bacteroidota bacterium]